MHTHLHRITNWPELAEQADWQAGKLAKTCKISLRTLERFFINKFQKAPKVWMTEQRQISAAKQLQNGAWPKEVTDSVGYKSQRQFSRAFKDYWGHCPTQHVE